MKQTEDATLAGRDYLIVFGDLHLGSRYKVEMFLNYAT